MGLSLANGWAMMLKTTIIALTFLIASACGSDQPLPVSGVEKAQVKTVLAGRSFRQFDPSVDASPRKGIVLNFFGPISLWAQYSEGGRAVNEWEIVAEESRIEKHGDTSEVTIHLDGPRSKQELPDRCDDCIQTSGVSISIRNVFDGERIAFKLNDPDGVLPSPFPVFESWTRFTEDEIVH